MAEETLYYTPMESLYRMLSERKVLTPLYVLYLLFTNWVQGPYQEIQAQGFS